MLDLEGVIASSRGDNEELVVGRPHLTDALATSSLDEEVAGGVGLEETPAIMGLYHHRLAVGYRCEEVEEVHPEAGVVVVGGGLSSQLEAGARCVGRQVQ